MRLPRLLTITALPILAAAPAAQAHHAMDGTLPGGFWEGFVSGLAHPVIGIDHLAFVVAAGVVGALVAGGGAWRVGLPILFVLASIVGVGLHLTELNLPLAEAAVAASVLLAGVLLARGTARPGAGAWAAILGLGGIFHGYAYGEAIVGAEPTALWAYLAGLAVIQSAIALAAARLATTRAWTARQIAPRLVGAAAFGVGLTALVAQIVPA
ncbi:MAG: HupE/UreJ family protein [Alphaproteobacteria bacterium]